jgi:hypothetical protein
VHIHDRVAQLGESSFIEGFREEISDEEVGLDEEWREDEEEDAALE